MSLPHILVVDDQFARNGTERALFLKNTGLAIGTVGGSETGTPYAEVVFCSGQREEGNRLINDYRVVREVVAASNWSLVLLDVQFDSGELDEYGRPSGQPGDDGFGMMVNRQLKAEFPDLPVITLTSKRNDEIAETDTPYLSKHRLGSYELRLKLLEYGRVDAEALRGPLGLDAQVCAEDPATLAAFRDVFMHAKSNASILILGESGTGKEVLARYVYRISGRKGKFLPVNVAAIPSDLVESELFGIGKGIASSVGARPGKFELASGGTLFLDEIGDMPLETQAKVLRALQERRIVRVGEANEIPIDIQLVCATSRDLENRVVSGSFRGDLLHRINTITITMPPLRERRKDIAPLARIFLEKFTHRQDKTGLSFSAEAVSLLQAQQFPGNVRQLENLVERLVSSAGHHQIIGKREVLEAIGNGGRAIPTHPQPSEIHTEPPESSPGVGYRELNLNEALAALNDVCISKDDPQLKGALARLDEVTQRLRQRLAGAALERCRNPITNQLKREPAMQLLTGDENLKQSGPKRVINTILNRVQSHPVSDEDLNALIESWLVGKHEPGG